MYAKVQDGNVVAYPYVPSELIRDNPDISFPFPMPDTVLEQYGLVPVKPNNPPQYDYVTENCNRVDPQFIDGEWVESWVIVRASEEEIQQRLSELASNIRSQRDLLLKECDWTQLPDVPVNIPAWSNYRQNLRDIPIQSGFPQNVVWPEKPE